MPYFAGTEIQSLYISSDETQASNDAAVCTVGGHHVGHIQAPDPVPDLGNVSIAF